MSWKQVTDRKVTMQYNVPRTKHSSPHELSGTVIIICPSNVMFKRFDVRIGRPFWAKGQDDFVAKSIVHVAVYFSHPCWSLAVPLTVTTELICLNLTAICRCCDGQRAWPSAPFSRGGSLIPNLGQDHCLGHSCIWQNLHHQTLLWGQGNHPFKTTRFQSQWGSKLTKMLVALNEILPL